MAVYEYSQVPYRSNYAYMYSDICPFRRHFSEIVYAADLVTSLVDTYGYTPPIVFIVRVAATFHDFKYARVVLRAAISNLLGFSTRKL